MVSIRSRLRDHGSGAVSRTGKDRGSSAIELAILAPLLLVMIWLTIGKSSGVSR